MAQSIKHPPEDARLLIKWLEDQPVADQKGLAEQRLIEFLAKAAQPRHVSGNSCIKLCFFIEQCRASISSEIRDLAFADSMCLSLFTFYIEWNEKNQNRSMRQVLELVSSLIAQNPNEQSSTRIKKSILSKILAIITHKTAQPLVKPAFKSLECLLSKGTISTDSLIREYRIEIEELDVLANEDFSGTWDRFFEVVFDWMSLPDISPAAGKFLVTAFRELRLGSSPSPKFDHTGSWQRWIRRGLIKDTECLENVKNYLFPPLFKLDRPGSIFFLQELNKQKPISNVQNEGIDAHALLQLAAIETGKKLGLVEELNTVNFQKSIKKTAPSIVLEEAVISPLLIHASETVRSLAFSVLVSSSSSIRPFTSRALDIFQSYLPTLYSDTDAKFRNEVLSSTKHMIERLRGATGSLRREIINNSSKDFGNSTSQTLSDEEYKNSFDSLKTLMRNHEAFTEWYLEFLIGELIPTASYQRHVTALRAICLLLQSGILEQESRPTSLPLSDHATLWPFSVTFFTPGSIRLLLDLLMDPFEDVRGLATSLLKLASPNELSTTPQNNDIQLKYDQNIMDVSPAPNQDNSGMVLSPPHRDLGLLMRFIERASEAAKQTGRADYADGVARSYELLFTHLDASNERITMMSHLVSELEYKVAVAEKDLSRAVLDASIHGTFAAINFVWDAVSHKSNSSDDIAHTQNLQACWNDLQVRMYSSCSRVWDAVKQVLCNDSPEGHLPQSLNESDNVDTKDLLSYSFRAIHESSNLMRTMILKSKLQWQEDMPVLPLEVFESIGNLTYEQLSSLRHRGAFSTVSLTFARCCQLTQHQYLKGPRETSQLLEKYYQGTLRCILEQASTTRRSAGIPALMTGILSANSQSPAFEDVIKRLKSLARQPAQVSEVDETNLPQVHAMNSLKEVFKSSTLGKRSEGHIADCLQLAVGSLNSEVWAIRNCGLLLLRSLIDCLFGTSDSKTATEAGWDGKSVKLSYDKHPNLHEILLELLDPQTGILDNRSRPVIGAVESVFPALDIIRRAGPPGTDRDELYERVSMHLGSKMWHVREIAARTICTLSLFGNWEEKLVALVNKNESSNRFHGVLLAVKFILERRFVLNARMTFDALAKLPDSFYKAVRLDSHPAESPQVSAAKVEVINAIGTILLSGVGKSRPESLNDLAGFLFPQDSYNDFAIMVKFKSDAGLANAMVQHSIYTSALLSDGNKLSQILRLAAESSTDIALSALKCFPQAWKSSKSKSTIEGMVSAYLTIIEGSQSPEVRSVALVDLADILDEQFRPDDDVAHVNMISGLKSIGAMLQNGQKSPNLSNAEIRMSGWLLVQDFVASNTISEETRLKAKHWGILLCIAGDSRNDFDTRYSAAAALYSFYGVAHTGRWPRDKDLLVSLLALYDTLSDDDDEVRDLGAATVSSMLGGSLVPLAARKLLAHWLVEVYGQTEIFVWNVIHRMTDGLTADPSRLSILRSAESEFSDALREDNALFIEEEQNLFIDEIREINLWSEIFRSLPNDSLSLSTDDTFTNAFTALATWTATGLHILNELPIDGSLGWASKPRVFTVSMKVLACTNLVLEFEALNSQRNNADVIKTGNPVGDIISARIEPIVKEITLFVAKALQPELHQILLWELLSPRSLERNKLNTRLPQLSLILSQTRPLVRPSLNYLV